MEASEARFTGVVNLCATLRWNTAKSGEDFCTAGGVWRFVVSPLAAKCASRIDGIRKKASAKIE
jgi:hypothetical protein